MKKASYTFMLFLVLFSSFWLPAAWTASSIGLTVANIIAGTGITLDKTSTTVTVNATAAADGSVTYAKIQDVSAASRLLGRGSSSGSGDVEEIALGTGLTMSGTTISATGLVDPVNCTVGAGADSWACGTGSVAAGARGQALGDGASASGQDSVSIGYSALAGTSASTIAIGASSQATASNSIAIGKSSLSSNTGNVIIGTDASDGGWGSSVGIGYSSLVKNLAVGIGYNVTADCTQCVAIGYETETSSQNSVAIGYSADAGGSGGGVAIGAAAQSIAISASIAIGAGATANHSDSIVIGRGAASTVASQAIIGSNSNPITTLYVGEGVTDVSPAGLLFSSTGGSGSNVAGGHMTLRAGLATGNAATGDVIVAGANAGASSSTLQTAVNRWLFKGGTGHMVTGLDNTYDIGASGATRPRTIYLGTSVITPAITISGGTLGAGKILTDVSGDGIGTWQAPAAGTVTVGTTTATSGTVGSILFVATGPIIQQDNSNFFWDDGNNRLGLGTTAPDGDIGFGGVDNPQTPRKIIVGAQTAGGGSTGKDLIVEAGSAALSETDATGGNLVLRPGTGTGTRKSAVKINASFATVSGSVDQNNTTPVAAFGGSEVLSDGVTEEIMTIAAVGHDVGGGHIDYCVHVKDASDAKQIECGRVTYLAYADGTPVWSATQINKEDSEQLLSTGSLTVTWSMSGTGTINLDVNVNANSSLTPSTGYPYVTYTIYSPTGMLSVE